MSNLLYSQNGQRKNYPKKISDSTWEITSLQMKMCNKVYVDLKEAEEVINLLQEGVDSCIAASKLYDSTNSRLQRIIGIQEQVISDKDAVINKAVIITKDQSKTIKRLNKYNTLLKLSSTLSIIIIGVLILL